MSKRSSPGSDDDSPAASADEPLYNKRRLVEFEPIRICSVSGTVNFHFFVSDCMKDDLDYEKHVKSLKFDNIKITYFRSL